MRKADWTFSTKCNNAVWTDQSALRADIRFSGEQFESASDCISNTDFQ